MKKIVAYAVAAICISGLVSGCSNQKSAENQDSANDSTSISIPESQDGAADVDLQVDWKKPLYTIDSESGDTTSTWLYTDTSTVEYAFYTEQSFGYEGDATTYYDKQGRLISYNSSINSGNIHDDEMDYTYNGKVRTGEGINATQGYPVFTQVREITYFADDELKQDTLSQTYTADVEWDTMEDETAPETVLKLDNYISKKFVNGLLKELTCYTAETDSDAMKFSYRIVYEYNSAGLLIKSQMLDEKGVLMGEYAETTYTYKDNMCISSNDGTESITYYAKK